MWWAICGESEQGHRAPCSKWHGLMQGRFACFWLFMRAQTPKLKRGRKKKKCIVSSGRASSQSCTCFIRPVPTALDLVSARFCPCFFCKSFYSGCKGALLKKEAYSIVARTPCSNDVRPRTDIFRQYLSCDDAFVRGMNSLYFIVTDYN